MGKFKELWEASGMSGYVADSGEPDTGFIKGDKKNGKIPEKWDGKTADRILDVIINL